MIKMVHWETPARAVSVNMLCVVVYSKHAVRFAAVVFRQHVHYVSHVVVFVQQSR